MTEELTKFFKAVFQKQQVSFTYKDQSYALTLYKADINNKTAANFFLQTVRDVTNLTLQENPAPVEQLMKLYLRLRSSDVLETRGKNIIRRGSRIFDVRTLASRTTKSDNFKEHITFASLPYPNKTLDASERYNYLINKMKLEQGKNPDPANLFEKAIYINNILESDINENDYYNYVETILQKLKEWEKAELEFIESKTEDELNLILEGKGVKMIRKLNMRYLKEFNNEFNNPLFQKLLFELEGLYYWFWENIFLSVYAEISHTISEVERKAYLLFYLRQNYLDFHIPAFEHLIIDFFEILTKQEKIELIYLLLFSEVNGRNSQIKIYDVKFSDFLKFYPIWLDIMRLDEKLSDEELLLLDKSEVIPTMRPSGTRDGISLQALLQSIFEPLSNESDCDTLEEILPAETDQVEKYDSAHLAYLIETKLTIKQREVIELLLSGDEEHTQESIAQKLGISQSAVNQGYKSALSKLKKFY